MFFPRTSQSKQNHKKPGKSPVVVNENLGMIDRKIQKLSVTPITLKISFQLLNDLLNHRMKKCTFVK